MAAPTARTVQVEVALAAATRTERERLAALHKHLGFSRAVIVQASCHGTDNSAMMDALAHSNGAWRYVVELDGGGSSEFLDYELKKSAA